MWHVRYYVIKESLPVPSEAPEKSCGVKNWLSDRPQEAPTRWTEANDNQSTRAPIQGLSQQDHDANNPSRWGNIGDTQRGEEQNAHTCGVARENKNLRWTKTMKKNNDTTILNIEISVNGHLKHTNAHKQRRKTTTKYYCSNCFKSGL